MPPTDSATIPVPSKQDPVAVPVQPPRNVAGRLDIRALKGSLVEALAAAKANRVGDAAQYFADAVSWLRDTEKSAEARGRLARRAAWMVGRWLEHHAPRSPGMKDGLYAAALKAAGINDDAADRLRAIGRIPVGLFQRMLDDDGKQTQQRYIEVGRGFDKNGKAKTKGGKRKGRVVSDDEVPFTELIEKILKARLDDIRALVEALHDPRVLEQVLMFDELRYYDDALDAVAVIEAYPLLRPLVDLGATIESLYQYARDEAARGKP